MLGRAVERIAALPGLRAGAVSRVYLTEPQGLKEQPWFANCAMQVWCGPEVSPQGLLRMLRTVEDAFGRTREVRFGPRTLDVDILLFGETRLEGEDLTIPHPRMRERAFVLAPLAEIAPDLVLPWGETPVQALAKLVHRMEGRRIWQG